MKEKIIIGICIVLAGIMIMHQAAKMHEKGEITSQTSNFIGSLVEHSSRLMNSAFEADQENYLINRDSYMRFIGRFSENINIADSKLHLHEKYPNAMLILSNLATASTYLPLRFEEFAKDDTWVMRMGVIHDVLRDKVNLPLDELLAHFDADPRIMEICEQLQKEWEI